jgi:DNA-binding response OmpR family regulator
MEKLKVLLVEDDVNLGNLLREYLNAKGYLAELYCNGQEGYNAFMKISYDICILDVMMPIKDGFSLAEDIRLINSEIPIIFLTAKSLKDDVYKGFQTGADDYMTKPFSMQELLLRMEAILRRTKKTSKGSNQKSYNLGKYIFDVNKQQIQFGDTITKLTTKESELLHLLANNMNEMVERNFTLETIWGNDTYFNARSMDVYITKLRKYFKDDPNVEIINVHGKGFKLIITT